VPESSDIGDLELFLVATLKSDATLTALLGGEHYYAEEARPNDADKAVAAIVVFNIFPLGDGQGQTRRRNAKAFVDVAVITDGPPTDASDQAVAKIDALFEYVVKAPQGNHEFSVRGDKPIRHKEQSANTERGFYHRGRTYKVWITKKMA
jgi:hypothetical protein